MKKVKLFLIIMLSLVGVTTFASTIVSETKLNDGSYIRKCRFSNGVVDYCGTVDAMNAMRAINDLSLTASPQQLAEMKRQEKEHKAQMEKEAQQYISKLSKPATDLNLLSSKELNKISETVRQARYFVQDNENSLTDSTKNNLNAKIADYNKVLTEIEAKQEAKQELVEHVKNGIRTNFDGGFQAVQRFENATKIFDAFNRAK